MFDHVKFGVSDFAASKAFFLAALGPLGLVVVAEGPPTYGVELSVDSQGTGANGTPTLTVGTGTDAGPGAALLRVLVEAATTDDGVTPCTDADFAAPLATAVTTATATATILNAQQGGSTTVVQSGQPFNCSNWVADAGASIAGPNVNMDVELPLGAEVFDHAAAAYPIRMRPSTLRALAFRLTPYFRTDSVFRHFGGLFRAGTSARARRRADRRGPQTHPQRG